MEPKQAEATDTALGTGVRWTRDLSEDQRPRWQPSFGQSLEHPDQRLFQRGAEDWIVEAGQQNEA